MNITVKFDSSLKFYFVAIDDSTFKTAQNQKLYSLAHRGAPATDNVPAFANVTMTCILWLKEKIERLNRIIHTQPSVFRIVSCFSRFLQ